MKNYSLLVHALHSRLQLVRNKLDANPAMDPSQLVIRNQRIFLRASQSVEQHHNQRCNRSDFIDAAELFLMTLENDDIMNQPIWTVQRNDFYVVEVRGSGDEWFPLTEEMAGEGKSKDIIKSDHAGALALYKRMCKRGSSVNFRVTRYTLPRA